MEEKNKMKTYQIIIAIIITALLIGLVVFAYIKNQKNIEKALNQIRMEEKKEENLISEEDKIQAKEEELDFNSELVQSIFPLTGAFPENDFRYITKIKNMDTENITNDFILKLAWSKVTKEDWADSYQGEGSLLSIDASVLDKYIKDIFGDISYTKTDFNNKDLVLENSKTSLYSVTYNEQEDRYYIDFEIGDGVLDSLIISRYPKAIKYDDRIEITIHPIYIKNIGEKEMADGSFEFAYIAYRHYNYETKSFMARLTDTIYKLYKDVEAGEPEAELNESISGIKESNLEAYVLTYKLNKETNKYEFSSLTAK